MTTVSPAPPASPAVVARRALLVVNPQAGGGRGVAIAQAVERRFAGAGWSIELAFPQDAAAATAAARRAADRGLGAVLVLGGDGSVRAALAGLLGSATALGALPGGTTNVIVRALGLPTTPLAAAAVLARGGSRWLDVGWCAGEPFLMQASLGLDAAVMAELRPRLKRTLGRFGVVLSGLASWWRYRFPTITVQVAGETIEARGVVVANLAEYAGTFRIVPAARPDDGRLDVLLWRGRGRRQALSFALDLARGRHLERTDVAVRVASTVAIAGPAGAPLQLDGDARPLVSPLTVALAEAGVAMLVPASPGA